MKARWASSRRAIPDASPLAEMTSGVGVGVHRDGKPIGFWERGCKALEPGGLIIEIIPRIDKDPRLEAAPGLSNDTSPRL